MSSSPAAAQRDIEIGRILLAVSSPCPLLPQDDLPWYAEFLRPAPVGAPDCAITLVPYGDRPAPPLLGKPLFDSGRAWKVFADGDGCIISCDSPGPDSRLFWRVRADADLARCEVSCGHEFLGELDGAPALRSPVRYPLDQILVMQLLARRGGALLHAAGAVIDGSGVIFPGRSGAGKSTVSACLAPRAGCTMLSDDRTIVRGGGGAFSVFGTPWPGSARIARNREAPLRAIFFPGRGDTVRIERLDPREALELLLPATSVPWFDPGPVALILSFLGNLVTRVPAYRLLFAPHPEVADAVAECLAG